MGIFRGVDVSFCYILVLVISGEGIGGFSCEPLTICDTMEVILFLTASLVFVTRVGSLPRPLVSEELR